MGEAEQLPVASMAGMDLRAQIEAKVAISRHRVDSGGSAGHISVAELKASHLNGPSAGNGTSSRAAAAQVASPPAPKRARHRKVPAAAGPTRGRRVARLVMLILLTGLTVIGLRTFVVASYYIPSASMETTLHGCPGCQPDMVLVDKLTYHFKSISRTDVVVFNRPPLAPPQDKELIKRVIGLPGDSVSGHGGHVYINGKQLIEPYVDPACHGTADFAAITVPPHDYFMMGDNRCDSFDSRMFGPIPRSSIVGRAFAVIWPSKHLRWL